MLLIPIMLQMIPITYYVTIFYDLGVQIFSTILEIFVSEFSNIIKTRHVSNDLSEFRNLYPKIKSIFMKKNRLTGFLFFARSI